MVYLTLPFISVTTFDCFLHDRPCYLSTNLKILLPEHLIPFILSQLINGVDNWTTNQNCLFSSSSLATSGKFPFHFFRSESSLLTRFSSLSHLDGTFPRKCLFFQHNSQNFHDISIAEFFHQKSMSSKQILSEFRYATERQ